MDEYVISLEQLGVHDVERVGGKNASLGEMMSIGDADSATVRSATRVPVTIRVSSVFWAGACDCADAVEAENDSARTTATASGLVLQFMR